MVDLEQQIKAWADASAPATGASIAAADVIEGRHTAPAVIPIGGHHRRGRWLAVAAAVVVIGAIGVGVAVLAEDDGSERVRSSDRAAATTTADDRATTSAADSTPLDDITFEILGEGGATDAPIGSLTAAQTPAELAGLWTTSMRDLPLPKVDFASQVVVSMTIGADGCRPELTGFLPEGTTISPRFLVPGGSCEEPFVPMTYVVAIDWASVGDEFTMLLLFDAGGDGQQETLVVTRRSATAPTTTTAPPAVTTTTAPVATTTTVPQADPAVSSQLDLDGTSVASGGELRGTVVIVNNSGQPIEGGACGDYFAARLANDEYRQEIINPACGGSFTIPLGRSTYPVQILGSYTSCTTNPDSPDDRACDPDGSLPGLPPGEYQLTIEDGQHLVPAIDPVTITVT